MYMHLQILVSDTKLDSKCNLQNKETCQIPLSFWVSEIETEIEFEFSNSKPCGVHKPFA